jgi:predicted transposase YbfD/YdcC
MDYNILMNQVAALPQPVRIGPYSLYAAFEQISDGRHKRGRRYPLAVLLSLIVLAKLSGETTLSGVVDWSRHRQQWIVTTFHLAHGRCPCFSTYTYALRKLSAEEITPILAQTFCRAEAQQRCGEEPSRLHFQGGRASKTHLALDGKTLRGTLGHEVPHQPPVHQLTCYEVATGIVLAACTLQSKENEISALDHLLTPALVQDRIITADAMHTHRRFCQHVTQWGGAYVLIAKDNQPTLHEDLALFFTDPPIPCPSWQSVTTLDKGHGRLERRTITTSTELREWFARDWSGIEQVFRIERVVTRKGKTSREVVYGITSLTPRQAGPAEIGQVVRRQWWIENRLHWRRDVTLREDASQVRTRQVPEILALLNSAVLALLEGRQVSNVPAQRRRFAAYPAEALCLVLGDL